MILQLQMVLKYLFYGKLKGGEIHGDHVFPRSKGGKTVVENGKLETAEYNKKKSDKNPIAQNG